MTQIITKLKSFLVECKRVFQVTRKPTKKEFLIVVKVAGAGILIIGAIGFLIHVAGQFIV